MRKANPNPAGRTGKPIIVPQSDFGDAIKKVLKASPPPKEEKPSKKPAKKR